MLLSRSPLLSRLAGTDGNSPPPEDAPHPHCTWPARPLQLTLRFAAACLIPLAAFAQGAPVPVTLQESKVTAVASVPALPVMNPARCDAGGNIYFRAYQRSSVQASTLFRVDTREGTSIQIDSSRVDADSIKNPASLRFTDFFVSASSVFISAVDDTSRGYVLVFSSRDGKFKNAFPLAEGVHPLKVAAFDSGAFVIVGVKQDDTPASSQKVMEQVQVLYDANGTWVKALELEPAPKRGSADKAASAAAGKDLFQSLSLSLIEGANGALYWLEYGRPALLHIIKADGTVESTHPLVPPGEKDMPVTFRALGNSVLVENVTDPANDGTHHRYVKYDLTRDEAISIYDAGEGVRGAFACFDWRQTFTFVTSQNGHMALLTAVAR